MWTVEKESFVRNMTVEEVKHVGSKTVNKVCNARTMTMDKISCGTTKTVEEVRSTEAISFKLELKDSSLLLLQFLNSISRKPAELRS